MTINRNLTSTVAAVLAIGAMLSCGGVTASLAGSNDSGPFQYTTQSNGPDRARASAYPETQSKVQIQQTMRGPTYPANAYGSYAADRELVPGARVPWDFPRGAQGG